ncbi:MAG: hypothetical protein CVU80_02540 [Elusimicrobia bacterium HGW-Elusimicrobia-4]|nr:MAG: hypothetical protein CVU80_02540 [Elusimicrobia bacterium HGW-Elusimicrobia-4]
MLPASAIFVGRRTRFFLPHSMAKTAFFHPPNFQPNSGSAIYVLLNRRAAPNGRDSALIHSLDIIPLQTAIYIRAEKIHSL